jgi:hypothetical protein
VHVRMCLSVSLYMYACAYAWILCAEEGTGADQVLEENAALLETIVYFQTAGTPARALGCGLASLLHTLWRQPRSTVPLAVQVPAKAARQRGHPRAPGR